jgi:predicted nucleic acid-binding Zn ribbon protein
VRKDNLIKLGDAINQMLKQERLDVKLSRFAVKNAWEEIAGKMIANHTTQIAFDEQKSMFLSLDSSALKSEVMYSKSELIKKINAFCGYELINNLVVR